MTNEFTNSQLNYIIPPEIKDDEFYYAIQKLAQDPTIKTVLEIGSSAGGGSTEAFVTGLRLNPNQPSLFCMEISQTRFAALQERYAQDNFVQCYNVSSVSLEGFPSEAEVIEFYQTQMTGLNRYGLDQVLLWLRQDIDYVKNSGVPDAGIRRIKQEHQIQYFDLVLIDGSEFTGEAELQEVYGAKFILLDDSNTLKNHKNYQKLLKDSNYELVQENQRVRNGYAIFRRVREIESNQTPKSFPLGTDQQVALTKPIFFFCGLSNDPEKVAYLHAFVCIAEGLKALNIPFYSNINYWQTTPGSEYLFRHDPAIQLSDCSIVILDHHWFRFHHPLPDNLFNPNQSYVTVYMDFEDGAETPAYDPPFRQFDLIFRPHYNRKTEHPSNFVPWAFGLSNRILQATQAAANSEVRDRHLLLNFRHAHPLRTTIEQAFIPRIQPILPIDQTSESLKEAPTAPADLLQWQQTGSRHYPQYYQRLLRAIACACFGGLIEPHPVTGEPIGRWWDSWRFWESLAAGCATFHLDFDKYGITLPVMPENGRHYIGVDLDNIDATLTRLQENPNLLAEVGAAGREWALANYSPIPTAERFLQTVLSSAAAQQRQITTPETAIAPQPTASPSDPLPVHFFTIVLNGEPFIRYHIEVLKQLPFQWHWHIVEGVAELKHDTAWSLHSGGKIPDHLHREGRSCDGTSEYLDELARQYPNQITLYRKPNGIFWDGKREMVSAPLANIRTECLLWQIDADELWTVEQLRRTRQLFIEHPEKTAAFYWCWYFVGPNLVVTSRNCYSQNPRQEWLRTWRYQPGAIWLSHEPPRLAQPAANGQWQEVARINPFSHQETEPQGLVFQHFAYVTPEQLQFKEQYYGYTQAESQWRKLQQQSQFPIYLRDYFAWVQDNTTVDRVETLGVPAIAQLAPNQTWQFVQSQISPVTLPKAPKQPLIVIDGVFFQLINTGIARVWTTLLTEWSRSNFAPYLLVLDRAGTAPKIPGIRYRTIPPYNYRNTSLDRALLQQICDAEQASLFISTYYTAPISTPSVFMAYDMIPERIGWNLDQYMWREKHYAIQHAFRYLAISQNTARDLVRFFPYVDPQAVTVAPCGVQPDFTPANDAEVIAFRQKHQITQSYFLIVGTRNGYKNTILFFKAFAKLPNATNFSIVCTGGNPDLEPELSACLPVGTRVHLLQLNDAELRLAYTGAIALVYPSQYEGFGLPIVEAMASGCPVITCPNGSIPEVAGQAAIYINHTDVEGLAAALQKVQHPQVRQQLVQAGLAQAQQFSWSQMAKTVCQALMAAVQAAPAAAPYSPPLAIASVEEQRVVFRENAAGRTMPQPQPAPVAAPVASTPATPVPPVATYEQYQQTGRSLLAEHRLEDAIQALEKAHQLSPRDPVALRDLGTAYKAKADNSRMRADFYLGFALYRQGKYQAAIERYQKFLATDKVGVAPELIQRVYKCLGDCFQRLGQYEAAIQTYQEAVQAYPIAKLYFDLISALRDNGQTEVAIATATQALNLIPDDFSLKLAQQLTLPILYDSVDEIAESRQRFTQGLAQISAELDLSTSEASQNALTGISRYANFYLAYQGENDRTLQQQYGLLVHQVMATNYPQWVQDRPMPALSSSGKIRIGYLSDCLRQHTVGKLFLGWLRHYDRQKFEIYCYSLNREQDTIAQEIQRHSDAFHQISGDLEGMCQQILNDDLHVLTFLDIGMHPKASQIASLRLAPVQCMTWGHPVTSGLPTVDYFLSSDLMEPENGEAHYSEQLVRLPGIGIAYAKPTIPELTKTRADFGLRSDAVVYLSCQSLFKYLPQYDFVFAAIAQQVPQAQFAFLAHFSPAVTEKFRQRLQRAFAAVGLNSEDYCVMVPRQGPTSYLQLNLLSDIFLDTFAWSGGNTTLEAIACNLPVVTCPGEFMRGRHAAGILQALGIPEAIAANPEEYVAITVKLGLDSAWRQQMVQRITQGHDQLYDDPNCVRALEAFYQQVVKVGV